MTGFLVGEVGSTEGVAACKIKLSKGDKGV